MILEEELPRGIRLTSQLGNPSVKIDIEIWQAIEPRRYGREVFDVVTKMRTDEGGGRVPFHDANILRQQFFSLGELLPIEQPIRMFIQFMPTFVVPIQRRKECGRIGRVDHDRLLVLSAQVENRG